MSLLDVLPTHYIPVHQSAIRALAWIRAPPSSEFGSLTKENPTVIASGGYDGAEYLLDIRDPPAYIMNRTRGSAKFCDSHAVSDIILQMSSIASLMLRTVEVR